MKTIAKSPDLCPYGIDVLTGEACTLMLRFLCDLTAQGKATVERCFSIELRSEPWNSGSADDPHVASIMLTSDMLNTLAIFALLDVGCTEVWLTEHAVFGIEASDTAEAIEVAEVFYKPGRRFRFGPHQDRNQHQMSGRVR